MQHEVLLKTLRPSLDNHSPQLLLD
jgi:hypothetical protein